MANPLRPADGQTGDEPAAGTQQHTEPQQPQGCSGLSSRRGQSSCSTSISACGARRMVPAARPVLVSPPRQQTAPAAAPATCRHAAHARRAPASDGSAPAAASRRRGGAPAPSPSLNGQRRPASGQVRVNRPSSHSAAASSPFYSGARPGWAPEPMGEYEHRSRTDGIGTRPITCTAARRPHAVSSFTNARPPRDGRGPAVGCRSPRFTGIQGMGEEGLRHAFRMRSGIAAPKDRLGERRGAGLWSRASSPLTGAATGVNNPRSGAGDQLIPTGLQQTMAERLAAADGGDFAA